MIARFAFLFAVLLPVPLTAQLLSAKGLSETERAGMRVFLQRCSICHLGVPPQFQTQGPILHKDLVASLGDAAVRKKILEGSARMPGFQYGLKADEVENVITYLKSVSKEAVAVTRPANTKSGE
jgi:mono/diheme cytochrome c family protein